MPKQSVKLEDLVAYLCRFRRGGKRDVIRSAKSLDELLAKIAGWPQTTKLAQAFIDAGGDPGDGPVPSDEAISSAKSTIESLRRDVQSLTAQVDALADRVKELESQAKIEGSKPESIAADSGKAAKKS